MNHSANANVNVNDNVNVNVNPHAAHDDHLAAEAHARMVAHRSRFLHCDAMRCDAVRCEIAANRTPTVWLSVPVSRSSLSGAVVVVVELRWRCVARWWLFYVAVSAGDCCVGFSLISAGRRVVAALRLS